MRLLLVLASYCLFNIHLTAQHLKWMGGIGTSVTNSDSEIGNFVNNLGTNVFIRSNATPYITMETYIECSLHKRISLRSGLVYWQLKTINSVSFLRNNTFFSSSESEMKNWSIPLTLHFKYKKGQIFGGLQENFIISTKTTLFSFNTNSSDETLILANNIGSFFKKQYLTSAIGINYQYKFVIAELKFYSSIGKLVQVPNSNGKTNITGINLSFFIQPNFNEN